MSFGFKYLISAKDGSEWFYVPVILKPGKQLWYPLDMGLGIPPEPVWMSWLRQK
jgi:hypothetical protein